MPLDNLYALLTPHWPLWQICDSNIDTAWLQPTIDNSRLQVLYYRLTEGGSLLEWNDPIETKIVYGIMGRASTKEVLARQHAYI